MILSEVRAHAHAHIHTHIRTTPPCTVKDYTFIYFCLQSAVTPIVSGEYSHHRERAAMASRVSFTQVRLEAELERCRAECQWDRIPAIIDQMQAARFHEDGEWSPPPALGRVPAVSWFLFTPFVLYEEKCSLASFWTL